MGWTVSRRIWFLLGAAALAVVGLLYLSSRRPPPQVSVVHVTRGDLSSSITSNGKVEPITPYDLRAKFDGFVDRVLVAEGQTVKAGQLLAVLNDGDVRAQLDQARAQLATEEDDLRAAQAGGRPDQASRVIGDLHAAQAQRDMLQRRQDALAKLAAQSAATPQELETNRAELDRANAQVDQLQKTKQEFERQVKFDGGRLALVVAHSRSEVASLEEKANSARLTAPISGTLYSLPVHVRDFVHVGDLLAQVADLARVRVRAYIDEPELGQVRPNQVIEVVWEALPDRTWTGRTESIPRQVVARGTRNVGEVLCSISNERLELIPNTTVDVRIQLNDRSGVLVVPRGAVQIEGLYRYVFLVDGGRLRRREIRIGLSNATEVEVLSGVQEGDTLALPGAAPLRDNIAVRVLSLE
jgi:HlyD family secretion protein